MLLFANFNIVNKMRFDFIALASIAMLAAGSAASAIGFASLKSTKVNLRVGPGKEYPIIWVFMKSNLPIMLLAEFKEWKKIKFLDETEGWVHQNMISRKNTAIVTAPYAVLYRYESDSQPMAKVEKNAIVKILKKDKDWIKIELNKIKGWMKKQDLWGIDED
jgi:SH3-like domain-containing protein